MENTIENKVKLFAQYYGSEASIYSNGYWNECSYEYVYNVWRREDSFMLLTSLSDITDEDAIEVSRILSGTELRLTEPRHFEFHINFGKTHILPVRPCRSDVAEFLRSKGYALPFNGVSVEEQIKRGWIRLKTK